MDSVIFFGDSVCSGQGLQLEDKFATLVVEGLRAAGRPARLDLRAHSGATIGLRGPFGGVAPHREVPVAGPTIAEQVTGYDGNPNEAVAIAISGGINDIDIRTILSPFTNEEFLRHKIARYCGDDMRALLRRAAARFTNKKTRILVLAYFPILSKLSRPLNARQFLSASGVGTSPHSDFGPVFDRIVELSMQFWSESSIQLQHAARDVNSEIGDDRIAYVTAPFTIRNAVFADEPWLFGLKSDLSPEDEVQAERRIACDLAIPPIDFVRREACHRASAGHPNKRGAQDYARAILEQLGK
jgi:hypothetical protein